MKIRQIPIHVALLLFAALLFFASAQSAHANDKLRVGYLPIAEDAPKFVGVQKGIFKKHGLDVELVRFESGPDQVSAVLSGAIQVGAIGSPGIVFAAAGGRSVVAFLNNGSNRSGDAGHEYYAGIVVPEKSTIRSIGDLKGKRVAANVLKSNSEVQTILQVQRWNRENPSQQIDMERDIRFVVLPFGSMPGALERNLADAASLIEPFMTQLSMQQPVRVVAPVGYAMPNWPISLGVAERDYARKNAEVLSRYRTAWAEAVAWIDQNRNETISVIQPYTGLDKTVLSRIVFPSWAGDMNSVREGTRKIMQGMIDAKLIKEQVDLDRYIVTDLRKFQP
ncbi:MAG: ABC transporter substrate-binding protein [Burkholderiaceae bacterium]